MSFYANYGGDGRNYTARAVYECFFDPNNGVIFCTTNRFGYEARNHIFITNIILAILTFLYIIILIFKKDYVVVEFDPKTTLIQLLLFSLIPGIIMIVSCIYMCGCSR